MGWEYNIRKEDRIMIRFFTFAQYHHKPNTGSTKIRVNNIVKYWDRAELYKYGEKPSVMIFQKVYMQADYKLHAHLECKKILDICDPDWLDHQAIKETIDNVDAVTCPTKPLADFMRQLTDKPIVVIPDRHDVELFHTPKKHYGEAKKLVWFGYKQNAELLKSAIPYLIRNKFELTVISNELPNLGDYEFRFVKHPNTDEEFIEEMQKNDICLLPQGGRPEDMFKSNNKTTKAWLCGLPVAQTAEDVDNLRDPEARQKAATECYNKAIKEYDCRLSVKQMKELIEKL